MTDILEQEIRALRARFWSPRDPEGRGFAALADAYRRSGDLDQAMELVADGLSRHPSFTSGYVAAAWLYRDRGEARLAESAARRALDLDPDNVAALRVLGELTRDRGARSEAATLFERLLELEPGDAELEQFLHDLRGAEGDSGSAVEASRDEDGSEEPEAAERDEWAFEIVEPVRSAGEASAARAEEDTAALEVELQPGEGDGHSDDWDFDAAPTDWEPSTGDAEEQLPTRTLADLYVRQGLPEQAVEVYRRLLEEAPDDGDLRQRLAELEAGIARGPDRGPAPPAEGEPSPPADSARSGEEVMESLARELATGPEETGDLSTPFAWAEDEPTVPATAERTISDYFADMLAWVPGAVPVESLAPDAAGASAAGEPVPIEALAPGHASGPDGRPVVPIELLAPDAAGQPESPGSAGSPGGSPQTPGDGPE